MGDFLYPLYMTSLFVCLIQSGSQNPCWSRLLTLCDWLIGAWLWCQDSIPWRSDSFSATPTDISDRHGKWYIYIKKKKWNACHSFEVTLRSRFSCTNNKGAICMHPSWPLWRKHKSEAVVLAEPEWGILVLWRLSFASACYLLRLVIHILKYLLNWWTRSSPDGLWEIGSLILLTPLPCSKRYSFKVV